jgi:hypothetical protein
LGSGSTADYFGLRGTQGGGAIKFTVSGTTTINGSLVANGQDAGSLTHGQGASGGSIWLICQTLGGNGVISANGGNANTNGQGASGGAGGRIALDCQNKTYSGSTTVNGGTSTGGGPLADLGTVYEPNIPETGLTSAILTSTPLPVSVNNGFTLTANTLKNNFGFTLPGGTCSIAVTGPSGYSDTQTGTVNNGSCTTASFTAPTVVGTYNTTLTISTESNSTFTFPVYIAASNKAKENTSTLGTPIYTTFTQTPNPTIIGQSNPTFAATGLIDSGNDQTLNAIPCVFTVTGPNSFSQQYTSANIIGGACSLTLPSPLPTVAGPYNVTLSVLGDTQTLTTSAVSFNRYFDIHLVTNQIPGNTTSSADPILSGGANPVFTSPVVKRFDNSTDVTTGTACKIVLQINSDTPVQYSSTINSSGQCTATVTNNTIYAGTLTVKTVVTISGNDFETAPNTISTFGFPSNKATESSTISGQPVYSSQSVSPVPTYAGETNTLTVSGLVDSSSTLPLANATCTFTVTGPNSYSQQFTATASAGICTTALTGSQLPKVAGSYAFTLSVPGDSSALTTPSYGFTRLINILTSSNLIPGSHLSSINPIIVNQASVLSSPVIYRANASTGIGSGVTCKVVLQINSQTPVEYATTTGGSSRCEVSALAGDINATGTATVKTVVSLLGNDYDSNYTFETGNTVFQVQNAPTSQVCANAVFRDDNSNGVRDGVEPLLAGITIRLRNSTTNAIISSQTTDGTNPTCFTALFDDTYTLEGVTPSGATRTIPSGGDTYSVTVGVGATENRSFGYNGNAQICPNPTFRDVNEDGFFNGADVAINGVTTRLYLASDVNNALETISTNGVLCFAPRSPANYVVEQTLPANSTPTTGGTITSTTVQRNVTHAFATQSNVAFGYRLVASNNAKAQLSPNQTKPVNTGINLRTTVNPTYVNQSFVNYPVSATITGLVDSGTNLALNATGACDATFSGPSFAAPITVSGVNVVNGECVIDNTNNATVIPTTAATGNQVVFTVQGDSGTLTSDPYQFNVTRGEVVICPAPYKDYNKNGSKDSTEPYFAGVITELYSGATLLQSITSNSIGDICFSAVDPGIAYTIEQVKPTGAVITTAGYTDSGSTIDNTITPFPVTQINQSYGYKGTATVCPNPTYRDDNGNGAKDGVEPNINGFTATLRDDNNITIGSFAINNTTCFTELLDGNLSLNVDPGSLNINNTTGGNTKSVTLTPGQSISSEFGYQNNATICALPYNDYNQSTTKDLIEGYITGFSTQLIRVSDSQVVQTISSTGSTTCFAPVPPGNYTISQTPLAGFEHLVSGNPVSPVTQNLTSALGVNYTTDIYYSGTGTVCFNVFQDPNSNGSKDIGESSLAGVSATLKDSVGTTISTATFTTDPSICFPVFATPQQYRVDVTQPINTTSTTGGNGQQFTLSAGQTSTRSFGYNGNPTVCPNVFRDDNSNGILDGAEPRLGGITIELKDATNTTIISSFVSNGTIQCFGPLSIDTYHVVSSGLSGYSATTSEDQTVTLQFATPSTPNFGYNGNGGICVNPTFRDDNQNGQFDSGEVYYSGLNTYLRTSSNGAALQTVATNASGIACFTSVAPGTYVITQTPPLGGASTTGGNQTIVLPAGGSRTATFGYTGSGVICPNPTFDDTNYDGVKQSGESNLAVVTNLYLQPDLITPLATLTTDINGTGCFQNLFNGTYTVTQTPPIGYQVSSSAGVSQSVTIGTGDLKSVTFGYTNNPEFILGSIRGFLYVDRNENGNYNPSGTDTLEVTVFDNDVPVTQQTVKLQKYNTLNSQYEDIDSQISTTTGTYAFNSLAPGDYKIVIPTILGLSPVQPNPSEKLVTITSNEKSFNNDFGFQYTARICPQLIVDKNNNSTFDGTDFDILANEGRYYQLSYTSFNGTQIASNDNPYGWFIRTTGGSPTPCIEHVPPRDYTLIVRGPNVGGSYSSVDLSFYSTLNPNNTFTVYLASDLTSTNRYFTTNQVDRTPSTVTGRVWNNKSTFATQTGPFAIAPFDANGDDNQTGTSGGHDYDYDNDKGYTAINLSLIKCADGFDDPIPTATWNLNPPTTTTASDGTYTFANVPPGKYGVAKTNQIPSESILDIKRGAACSFNLDSSVSNFIDIYNFFGGTPTNPSFTPGSTINLDYEARYQGKIVNQLYTDYNHDNQKNSWENECKNQACFPPNTRLQGTFTLKDTVTGDILEVYTTNISNNYQNEFLSVPPGDYTIEVSGVTNNTYPTITPGELTRQNIISTIETDTQTYGFNPDDNSNFTGRVFIDRRQNNIYQVDGFDNNPATTYDNDVALGSYTVELYYGNSLNQLLTTIQTNPDGTFSVPNLAEGYYSARVTTSAPSGTTCIRCSWSHYLDPNATSDQNLTFDFNATLALQALHDTLVNGVRDSNEIGATGVLFKVTSSDGYVVADNVAPSSLGTPNIRDIIPGNYTVEVVNIPLGISLTGGFTSPATYSILASENQIQDYAFTPFTNNSISGRAFIDRGALNNTYDPNGPDGNIGLTFDNEQALANATVSISGPGGILQTTTDSNGQYTISGIPSGRYTLNKDPSVYPGFSADTWNIDLSGPIATSVRDECATLLRCRRDQNAPGFNFPISFDTNTNRTNNYTFIYTNTISSQYIDDKNGDGAITFYSNLNYTETTISGTGFELETYTGETLPCSGQYDVTIPFTSIHYCSWTALPPGNYTIKKLTDLQYKVNTNTTRSDDRIAQTGVANFGNQSQILTNLNSSSINQTQFFSFFQFTPVTTNNASVIGRAYIDRNGNLVYQPTGVDSNQTTIEDNDLPLIAVPITLSGTSTQGAPVTKTITTGGDGRYQITDLPAGSYQIEAGE